MRPEGTQKGLSNYNYSNRLPFLAGVISGETLPRVYRILDYLFCKIEGLGGSVNDDLSIKVRNEHVYLEMLEAQDEVEHKITRQEAKELIIYEDAQHHHTWASKPNIRKYDYIFNGGNVDFAGYNFDLLKPFIIANRYSKEVYNMS